MSSAELTAILERLADRGPAYIAALYPDPDLPAARAIVRDTFTGSTLPADVAIRPVRLGAIDGEWIVPAGCDGSRRCLYVHGGGFISGDLEAYRPFAAHLADAAGVAVLSIDYRLAPEHPPEVLLDDVLDGWRWLVDNGPEGPRPADGLFIAGDSAGGGLAAAAMLALRDGGRRLPDAAVLLCAALDMSSEGDKLPPEARPAFLSVNQLYLQGRDPRDPAISPAFGDPAGLPPLYGQVSTTELGHDTNRAFFARARAAGVDARLDVWEGMPHDWQMFTPRLAEAVDAVERIGAFLRGRG